MLENEIIRHCSPTLAGMKTGNLFSYPFNDFSQLKNQLSDWNNSLNSRGVFLEILRVNACRALIYVYRKNRLHNDLSCPKVQTFLSQIGYPVDNLKSCLNFLSQRIQNSADFPHEIGLFLSYPFEDVQGFINHKGKNCKHIGCWKVYCNEQEKIKLFNKYKKCTTKYRQCLRNGSSIQHLTVAA
ncbi:cell surface protein [Acetobacterium bakii]|uniref:Cell surface protein n=1 Tax=Acetobacterium bakii TaxID=52689 RepID=A0A0L6TVG3_9FIRM|nr:cell surface protein [Acetobacterium bakii]